MDKKKEYTEDVKLQIYKIISKYAVSHSNIYSILKDDDELKDFISYAYTHYLDKLYSNFDPEKGALSTHIYACLDKLYPIYIQQAKKHVDFMTARVLTTNDPSRATSTNSCKNLYFTKSIDTCESAIESSNPSVGDFIPDSSLIDEKSDPYFIVVENTSKYDSEQIRQTEIGKIFEDCLNRYMNNDKHKNEYYIARDKDIIWSYTFREGSDVTYQSLADKWGGISRERVRQIIDKFYHWVSKDKKLREALKL